MSKRSAEQALRDELEAAKAALAKAGEKSAAARTAAEAARKRVVETDAARLEANARVERAERALAVLVPLPVEQEVGSDGAP